MSQSNETTITDVSTVDVDSRTSVSQTNRRTSETVAVATSASTKDTGRVHVGGGMMRF
ncbi:MAG: hypothetical protein QOF70_6412 [Acetobacteraceae bacterium]|jgi:hypothetical protein|nr:hypothetical protein [Acetobacteraceae bacterium]